ncbi:SET domain-containing protein [Armillaria gallica]|uniref:SET domain-containing protein n=1 Tax=Armillaria gallica TaxID=47427 RepID=A0A2H3DEW3_ARMGA|nr:SET domain-containing protein [Armillaria gallica]
MSTIETGAHVRLANHPTARSKAVAVSSLSPGALIISVESLATVLVPSEKGRRCDACHTIPTSLRRCSGCASFYYCDASCQSIHWKTFHKRMCKHFNGYTTSPSFQALAAHEKMDALLLSHLAVLLPSHEVREETSSALAMFMSLLPGPVDVTTPPICPSGSSPSPETLQFIFSRFGNNNFAMHSHFNTFGHGIFPLASRLFNHSCIPNAAAKYIISPSHPPKMDVIALGKINPGEEICLTYVDPALLQSRQQIFELTYGFKCRCSSCVYVEGLGRIPEPPSNPDGIAWVVKKLREFVPASSHGLFNRTKLLPDDVLCVLHESFLSKISETFSNASHDGPYDLALDVGETILQIYQLIYPENYPQIGLHLLEMAKTGWNQSVSTGSSNVELPRKYLKQARQILLIIGTEGDDGGPLEEIQALQGLLNTQ